MKQEVAMQKLRAAILSDGSLSLNGRNACLHMSLSDNKDNLVQREKIPIEDLLKFLRYFVTDVLKPLDITPLNGHPKAELCITKSRTTGGWLPGVMLNTQTSELLTELYHECYPNGRKAIPENLALTDVFLAWFFMFDGNSAWHNGGGPAVYAHLCTQGFDLHSIELLESQLHNFNLCTGRTYKKCSDGAGIGILFLPDSSDHFMSTIDPHVVPPYRYKIKYRGSCPPELAVKYRKDQREYLKDWRAKKKEEKEQVALSKRLGELDTPRPMMKS